MRDTQMGTLEWEIFSRYNSRIQGYVIDNADGLFSGYRDADKWSSAPPVYSDIEPIKPITSVTPNPGADGGDEN